MKPHLGDPKAHLHEAFPGKFAGASLKLFLIGEEMRPAKAAFPGKFAGASLKRGLAVRVRPRPGIFPRQIRRGLIEAS